MRPPDPAIIEEKRALCIVIQPQYVTETYGGDDAELFTCMQNEVNHDAVTIRETLELTHNIETFELPIDYLLSLEYNAREKLLQQNVIFDFTQQLIEIFKRNSNATSCHIILNAHGGIVRKKFKKNDLPDLIVEKILEILTKMSQIEQVNQITLLQCSAFKNFNLQSNEHPSFASIFCEKLKTYNLPPLQKSILVVGFETPYDPAKNKDSVERALRAQTSLNPADESRVVACVCQLDTTTSKKNVSKKKTIVEILDEGASLLEKHNALTEKQHEATLGKKGKSIRKARVELLFLLQQIAKFVSNALKEKEGGSAYCSNPEMLFHSFANVENKTDDIVIATALLQVIFENDIMQEKTPPSRTSTAFTELFERQCRQHDGAGNRPWYTLLFRVARQVRLNSEQRQDGDAEEVMSAPVSAPPHLFPISW
ncbi:MAG: hypothetical protein ACD_42C00558G0003 [uncultured bacterium]|nr:MAG: hypothetical protein ACD_42C00558G0003 [uncultured bacterium]OGT25952.1 MAG: hypothetical protein A3B71_07885 [Gammaproteobacteria bacterium RIFCSPHIGHO2_02_FULL_42_43]OGT28257.1 MAG: hypothetical protein A2624_02200 [Gammaproteobacteria bacterium RIFCSPHIGHO2_01_FULL_42_8]OGT52337.1 MAG: hypothetical protein A3E54_01765 [Gammaproteobacteria bacterium RIFCSPHIGHO2_12_FULL_41_25]OGT61948.1 MAG: hypothetical protein A3I77_01700 [Gammaproteobacteria bacterium RIFCSPLOWO2_02_FULL_42_14]OGT